ncbi:LamG domain-containing protein [Clostridium transplantifaecale]|uniref:LamG domain-containing protein n=1 Tax=Clostridium transplantifaecale TaxID=2479838 RepID=UPI000F644F41|nr:LamG domain-containing protein [Clostridium transplantifaecale]
MSLILWLPLNGTLDNNGLLSPNYHMQTKLKYSDNGKLGKCMQFDGDASQILSISNVPQKASNFSWSCWFCQTSVTTTNNGVASTSQYLLSAGRDCGIIGFNLRVMNGALAVHLGSAEDPTTNNTTASKTANFITIQSLSLDTWYHVTVTVDEATVYCYMNGKLVTSSSLVSINYASGNIAMHSYFTIGKMANCHANTTSYLPFVGYISDVRVYDHCLSVREVKEISKGLILHYPLSSPYCEPVTELYGEKYANGLALAKNGEITSNLCTDEDGSPYTNYSFSKPPESTKDTWYSINFGSYPFTAGKTYTISVDYRVNSCQNCDFTLRHARIGNDYFGCKTFSLISKNNVGKGWQHASITQVIPDKFDYNGTEKICKPQIEWYTGNLKNSATDTTTVRSANFDLKNVQVIEKDYDLPFGTRTGIEYDCSGYGNDGTMELETAPSWNADSIKYSGCYQFSSNHFIKFSSIYESKKLYECTIAFWFNLTSSTSYQAILIPCGNPSGGLWLSVNSENCRLWAYQGKNEPRYHTVVGEYFPKNCWLHVAFSFNNGVSKFYLDGKYQNSVTWTLPYIELKDYFSLGDSYGGDSWNETPFNGKLSDFRIYATALSDSNIKDLYETKFSLDNSGNFFVGELIEDTQTVAFGQNAVLSTKEFYEFDSQNLCYITSYGDAPLEYGYTPSTENNSKFEFYRVHQDTLQVGDIVVIDLDFEWSGGFDTSNTNGTFDLYFQGECKKKDDTTAYWVTNEYTNSLNSIKRPKELVLSSESGTFHYTSKQTVTASMLDYDIKFIGLRSNYSNGKGKVSFKNVCVRNLKYSDDGIGKLKIPDDGTLACKEIIEY